MKALLTRFDKWLAKNRSRFYKNLQARATPADLAALEKALGQPVPASLRDLLAWHNGQGEDYAGYFKDHWLLMDCAGIVAAKTDLDATGGDYGWKKEWLPFMDDDGGNFLVLDSSQQEPPVLAFWMGAKVDKVAPSLEAWLTDFVNAVGAGQYYEDPERGTFKRDKSKK
jgi:cell wall assembly regulator SMI1